MERLEEMERVVRELQRENRSLRESSAGGNRAQQWFGFGQVIGGSGGKLASSPGPASRTGSSEQASCLRAEIQSLAEARDEALRQASALQQQQMQLRDRLSRSDPHGSWGGSGRPSSEQEQQMLYLMQENDSLKAKVRKLAMAV